MSREPQEGGCGLCPVPEGAKARGLEQRRLGSSAPVCRGEVDFRGVTPKGKRRLVRAEDGPVVVGAQLRAGERIGVRKASRGERRIFIVVCFGT